MGSEMGNNNVSGIRAEEEKPAVEVAERGQEAAPADEVKVLGDKNQDFSAKGEELFSSDGLSDSNGSDSEVQKSNEKVLIPEIESKESKHESISQDASTESNNSSCQESDVQKTDSPDECNHEKPLGIHDQPTIGKETETKEAESNDLIDSKTMSNQPSESSNFSTSSLEDSQSSLSSLSDACKSEEKENVDQGFERDENLEESEESKTSTGTCDRNSREEKFGSDLEDTHDAQMHLRKNSSESCDSSTEVASQCNSLDASIETPEPEEMCIIHDKDNDMISNKSSEDVNNQEPIQLNSTGETHNELIINNSAPAVTLHDSSSSKENREEVMVHMTSTSSFEKVCPNGKVKVNHKRSRSAVAGKRRCSSIDQFEDIEEDMKKLLTFTSVSTQPSSTDKQKETINETGKREDFPSSMAVNNGDQRTSDECRSESSASQLSSQNDNETVLIPDSAEDGKKVDNIYPEDLFVNGKSDLYAHKETKKILDSSISTEESFKPANNIQIQIQTISRTSGSESLNWESNLLDTSSASQVSSQNGSETVLIPDAAEDGKKVDNINMEDLFVNGKSNLVAHKETKKILDSSISTVESFKPANNIQIQTTSRTSADSEEVLSNWSNQQCPSGQIPDLPNRKAQENSTRVEDMVTMESNPGQSAGNQVQQREKSPSFDFGFQLDTKSEDSDQTPLLHHDNKTAARSFSGFANVRFQNRIIQTDYGRKSLDFEPVGIEEKTIRMERSDSDISRASFMNLLKKDEKGSSNISPLLPKNQESPAAINNSEELSTEEVGLNSVKRSSSKQRKIKNSKASIFTSCICCTASIH